MEYDLANMSANAELGLRIDYRNAAGDYVSSVMLHDNRYSTHVQNASLLWGTKQALTNSVTVADLSNFAFEPADYAPANWTGKATLTYLLYDTKTGTKFDVDLNGVSTANFDWNGGTSANTTNWGLATNWATAAAGAPSIATNARFGAAGANATADMYSAGQTVGTLTFLSNTPTTIRSTGGYSLTLQNTLNDVSTIACSWSHTIRTPVVIKSDAAISGTGTLSMTGGISGNNALRMTSGTVVASSMSVNSLKLDRGSLTVDKVALQGTNTSVNFNGAELKAGGTQQTSWDHFLENASQATVQSGGAIINTNGHDVTVNQSLLHDAGATRGDGGLKKKGTGTLTISGNNSYSGITSIEGGVLKFRTHRRLRWPQPNG